MVRLDTLGGVWWVDVAPGDHIDPERIWVRIQAGAATLSGFIPRDQALELASHLATAAGVDDPIPVGEATISDWQTLEAAQ